MTIQKTTTNPFSKTARNAAISAVLLASSTANAIRLGGSNHYEQGTSEGDGSSAGASAGLALAGLGVAAYAYYHCCCKKRRGDDEASQPATQQNSTRDVEMGQVPQPTPVVTAAPVASSYNPSNPFNSDNETVTFTPEQVRAMFAAMQAAG